MALPLVHHIFFFQQTVLRGSQLEEALDNELKEQLVFIEQEHCKCSASFLSLPMKIQDNRAKEHKRTLLTEVYPLEIKAGSSVLKLHNRLGNHFLSCQYEKKCLRNI